MRLFNTIDLTRCWEWKLDMTEQHLFAYLSELPSWAKRITIGNDDYYWVSRRKVISDMPGLTQKEDTVYRILKRLSEKDLVLIKKIDGEEYIKLTPKGLQWNKKSNSEPDPTPGSRIEVPNPDPKDTLSIIESNFIEKTFLAEGKESEISPSQSENTSSPLKDKKIESRSEEEKENRAHTPARDPDDDYEPEPDQDDRKVITWLSATLKRYISKNPIKGHENDASTVSKIIARWAVEERGFKKIGNYKDLLPSQSRQWIDGWVRDNPPEPAHVPTATKCMKHLMGKKAFRTYTSKYPDVEAHMWHAYQFGMNDDIHPIPMYVVDDYPLGQDFYEWKKKEGSYFTNQAYYDRLLVYLEKKFPL